MNELLPTLEQLINNLLISLSNRAVQVILYDRSMNEIVKYDGVSEIEDKYKGELSKTIEWDGQNPILEIQLINYKKGE